MKKSILALAFLLAAPAWANTPPAKDGAAAIETHDLTDAHLGKFEISMEDVGEPVTEPYRMKVSSFCNDHRSGSHAMKPAKQELIKDEHGDEGVTVCDFISHEFDEKNAKLTLNYMRSSDAGQAGNCNAEWSQTFDLKQICAAWAQ